MTFSVPPEVKAMAQGRDEVNWSGFVANEIERYVAELEELDRRRARRQRRHIRRDEVKELARQHQCQVDIQEGRIQIVAGAAADRLRLAWRLEERFGPDVVDESPKPGPSHI